MLKVLFGDELIILQRMVTGKLTKINYTSNNSDKSLKYNKLNKKTQLPKVLKLLRILLK